MKDLIEILQALAPYAWLAGAIFLVVYHWAQQHNKGLADRLKPLEPIAEKIVAQQASFDDKEGSAKKKDATADLLNQAAKLKIPVTKGVAGGYIESAYAKQAPSQPAIPVDLDEDDQDAND